MYETAEDYTEQYISTVSRRPPPDGPQFEQNHGLSVMSEASNNAQTRGTVIDPSSSASRMERSGVSSGSSYAAFDPFIINQDQDRAQWIAVKHSRDKISRGYTIRCVVESISVATLRSGIESTFCVYPRVYGGKGQCKGNCLQHESDCNAVGRGLTMLDPTIQGSTRPHPTGCRYLAN